MAEYGMPNVQSSVPSCGIKLRYANTSLWLVAFHILCRVLLCSRVPGSKNPAGIFHDLSLDCQLVKARLD